MTAPETLHARAVCANCLHPLVYRSYFYTLIDSEDPDDPVVNDRLMWRHTSTNIPSCMKFGLMAVPMKGSRT